MRSFKMMRAAKLCGTAVATAVAFGAVSQACAESAEPTAGITDIVVTAQKREQRLQDVPASVMALGKDVLETNRINNVRDLDGSVPNLTIRTVGIGSSVSVMVLRGDNTIGVAPGSDKGVAVYIDGVFYASSSGAMYDLANIEQIEVLRGPQGTLFGRNSTGGAISITTAEPTGKFGLHEDLTYGNYDEFKSRTTVETPQFGPLSAVLTYTHDQRRGDVRNLGGGTLLDFSAVTNGALGKVAASDWLGGTHSDSVAAAVKLEVSSDVKLVYRFDYNKTENDLPAIGIVGLYPPLAGAGAGLISAYTLVPNTTPVSSLRPDAVNNAFSTPMPMHGFGHNLTATWRINDNLTLKNIAAFRKTVFEARSNQLDGMGGFFLPGPTPFFFLPNTNSGNQKQYSEELQVNYKSKFLTLTAGGNYFQQDIIQGGFQSAGGIYAFTAMPGFLLPNAHNQETTVTTKAYAAFAQGEFHLTDNLDFVLGGRITRDEKNGFDRQIPGQALSMAYANTKPTFDVGLNYRVNKDILTYAKYSTGYISGGSLAGLTYLPQTAKSWEAGVKADWLDRKLRTNLALFYVDYANVQTAIAGRVAALGVTDPTLAALVAQAGQTLVNQGNARDYGFELEVTAKPVTNVTLGANVGYSNFKVTQLSQVVALSGAIYPQLRPDWTLNLNGEYQTPEFGNGLSLRFNLNADLTSKAYAATGAATPELLAAMTIPTHWLVNGRLALQGFKVGETNVELAAWVKNMTNDRHLNYAANYGFVIAGHYEAARTFGADLSIKY